MSASREARFAVFAEPIFFFTIGSFAIITRRYSLDTIFAAISWHDPLFFVFVSVGVLSLFFLVSAECSRMPVDDPNTHLELTMIHEVMVLDHGGPAFGMILYGASLKLFVLGAVVVRLALPVSTGNAWADWGVFLAGMLLLAVVIRRRRSERAMRLSS